MRLLVSEVPLYYSSSACGQAPIRHVQQRYNTCRQDVIHSGSFHARYQVDLLFFFLFFVSTLVTGPLRSLRLKLTDTRVYEPQIHARLGTTAFFCKVLFEA